MGYGVRVGRYQLGRTIGEGTFAKVKMAVDTENGGTSVAIKVLDKKMVVENRLMQQVKREISAMKVLHHPNIVRIHEVIATKTKIYIVMEYVSGGQLSEKMSYLSMSEKEARKYFRQLIDAVDYCHARGIYHRDLKPENLLIDNKGNLKVSDFGLSALRKPGDMLSTACGSPSYVAPEVIIHKKYEGAAADVWSCGVILFELLAGFLPFEDRNTMNLYRKIARAEYKCPEWFTASQRKLLSRILEPMPRRRAKVAEILEDEWFRVGYEPAAGIPSEAAAGLEDLYEPLDGVGGKPAEATKTRSPSFINAFQLIAMSNDLDLSGLFEEQDDEQQKTKLCSKHPVSETIEKIQVAAMDASLSVERMNGSKVKLHSPKKLTRSISHIMVSAEVIEVTPTHCMIEISRSAGEIRVYKQVIISRCPTHHLTFARELTAAASSARACRRSWRRPPKTATWPGRSAALKKPPPLHRRAPAKSLKRLRKSPRPPPCTESFVSVTGKTQNNKRQCGWPPPSLPLRTELPSP